MTIPIIDCHNHIWKLESNDNFSWITEGMDIIRRDFSIDDLEKTLQENHISGSILVQAIPVTTESEYLITLAEQHDFIKGVIGWCDVSQGANKVQQALDNLKTHGSLLKGIRHMSQGLPPEHLITKDFIEGCQTVGKNNLVYELLITEDQLSHATKLIKACPDVTFVIEHIAKPNIKNFSIKQWQENIHQIALTSNNVYCKLSGMVTEADWHNWQQSDFEPYLDILYATFGEDKLIFGSDWPVCQVAGSYKQVLTIIQTWLSKHPQINAHKIFYQNAQKLYKL